MKTIQPNCAARLHAETPEKFRRRVADVMAGSSVSLQVVNDDVIVDAYARKGVALEDARDYAIIGCVEPTPSGLTYASTDAFFFNTALCLEMVLGGGKSSTLGSEGADTGDPRTFETFREVMEAYRAQIAHFIRHLVVCFQAIGQAHRELLPCAFESAMIRDCIEKGRDVKEGGARYNFTGGNAIGTAIVADSLMAIKRFVFDEKKLSMAEMIEILENDFEGREDTRLMFLNRAPKYGNDDDEVDDIAREVVDIFAGELDRYRNPRGGSFTTSLYSVTSHVAMGYLMSATPDGRKRSAPLSVGISPGHGRDRGGPTLALKSAAKIDYRNVLNGSAFNLKFHPSQRAQRLGLQPEVPPLGGAGRGPEAELQRSHPHLLPPGRPAAAGGRGGCRDASRGPGASGAVPGPDRARGRLQRPLRGPEPRHAGRVHRPNRAARPQLTRRDRGRVSYPATTRRLPSRPHRWPCRCSPR